MYLPQIKTSLKDYNYTIIVMIASKKSDRMHKIVFKLRINFYFCRQIKNICL